MQGMKGQIYFAAESLNPITIYFINSYSLVNYHPIILYDTWNIQLQYPFCNSLITIILHFEH